MKTLLIMIPLSLIMVACDAKDVCLDQGGTFDDKTEICRFSKKNLTTNIEKNINPTTQKSETTTMPQNITQYDAGTFDKSRSLDLDNQKAQDIRKKTAKNEFNKNRKHAKINKKSGAFAVLEVETKDQDLQYVIQKNGKEIYKSTHTVFITQEPFRNFVAQGNDWWLSYYQTSLSKKGKKISIVSTLIHNGKRLQYHEVFGLHNLNGKIIYFFKKDTTSKVQYTIDGKVYDTNFDDIIHDECCEPAMYNMSFSEDGRVAFWGIVDGRFTYNELSLFEKH